MRLKSLLRQALRLRITTVWSSLFSLLQGSSSPRKHIKIDDEESQTEEVDKFSSRPRSQASKLKMLLLTLLLLLVVVIILCYIIYKPPKPVINFLQWKYPDVLFQVAIPSSQRVVALTLDDTPSSETAHMLDLLKSYGAKATFFAIGKQISSHPGLLQRMIDEGHEIGNHAWADEPSINLPLSELERQIKEVAALIPKSDARPKYFRPGSGFFNKKMVETVKGMGYRVVLGSIYPHDPQIHNPRINAAHVLSMVRPGGIIIMHDRRSYSPDQLELVLKGLKAGGWTVESVGGLLKIAAESELRKAGKRR